MRFPAFTLSKLALAATVAVTVPAAPAVLLAQVPAAAPAAAGAVRSVGTVQQVGNGTLAVHTDRGDVTTFTVPDAVRVVQLAPGSTDLKTAQPAAIGDVAQGDRVLVTGRAGEGGAVTALRVVLMKGNAIAENNAAREQDWQRRGSGGVVNAVDPAGKTLTVMAGPRKETVTTTPATVYRRYAPGSVKFEDARLSKLEDIHTGDQVRVRGDKSADGSSMAADEVVSGAFRNLSGVVSKVDPANNTITLTDLLTKKPATVLVAADSDLRELPPEMAARFVARARGGAAEGASGAAAAGTTATAGQRPGYAAGRTSPQTGAGSAAPAEGGAGRGRGAAGDLAQVLPRLPKMSLAELKPGEAVMVVASSDSAPGAPLTAVTLLSGVEPLLAAPQGASSFNISPWSLGGGAEGGEGAGPQ